MKLIIEFRVAIIFFLLVGLAGFLVNRNTKEYKTGYVTNGNPDNTYLDSCEIYCCGD
jgi:hypothetical protein